MLDRERLRILFDLAKQACEGDADAIYVFADALQEYNVFEHLSEEIGREWINNYGFSQYLNQIIFEVSEGGKFVFGDKRWREKFWQENLASPTPTFVRACFEVIKKTYVQSD